MYCVCIVSLCMQQGQQAESGEVEVSVPHLELSHNK